MSVPVLNKLVGPLILLGVQLPRAWAQDPFHSDHLEVGLGLG